MVELFYVVNESIKPLVDLFGNMQNNLFLKYRHWLKGEALEQALFVNWLEENNYTFTSIPNSTWTKSKKQHIMNTLTGLRPGLCDLLIILKRGSLLFIELKKARGKKGGLNGSKISSEQARWISELGNIDNVGAYFAHGFEEAKRIVMECEEF